MNLIKSILLIITLTIAVQATAQLKRNQYFFKQNENNAFCSKSIYLDSLGYFFMEEGCEGRATISYGRYHVSKKNLISFHFLHFDSLKPIRNIKRIPQVSADDSLITISLFDRDNKPLDLNFNVMLLGPKGTDQWGTDIKGQIVLNKKLIEDIVLNSLVMIYGESPTIVNKDESAIEIYLNLPELLLLPTEITLGKKDRLQLLLKKDGLYKTNGKTLLYSVSN